ncbi:MAG: heavy metal translocating P-type ATPase [Armatimonadota bacterium]|nr:heavy metal translocating P-type ATPase [Armatimonadota bacterium]
METKTLDIPVALPEYYENCERCIERLKESLLKIEGMQSVELDEATSSLIVTYDASFTSIEGVIESARQIGVEIVRRYTHEIVTLSGLDCPDCAQKVERTLLKMDGVLWASVNYATSILSIEYLSASVSHQNVVGWVRRLGYDIVEEAPAMPGVAPVAKVEPVWRNRRALLTLTSGLFLVLGFLSSRLGLPDPFPNAMYAIALVTGGYYPARSGLFSARALALDTNFLMTAAALGAVALGEWADGAMVLFLFSLGSALEAYTVERTRRSIRLLIELFPRDALVKRNGREERVPIQQISVGETVIIKPGDQIAVDGVVAAGSSSVDQSAVTGESTPAEKVAGDAVFAGSMNQRGAMEVRVTSAAEDNTLSKIIHLVEEAQARKAPSQRFSERFGRIYTPLVIVAAVGLSVIPPLLGGDFAEWFRKSLILLVVSCPCALVISTPVAIVASIGNAARNGILVKGGAYLEELGRISVIAFDKTGTLTTGRLEVENVFPVPGHTEQDVLKTAATIESKSEHPLADAILARARARGVELGDIAYFEALPGMGARAVIDGRLTYIGNDRLLADIKLTPPEIPGLEPDACNGKTLMYVCVENTVLGVITATDTVKKTTPDAVRELRRAGIVKTVMITGDNAATARAVASDLGIDDVYSDLLPEEKVDIIRDLVKRHGRVAMVGDGINDAPALAAATIGIAMGGAGAHSVLETADVTLMADDLSKLPYSIRLSRSSLRIIKQNVTFAVIVVAALVLSTLVGWLTLAGGVIGHEGSALIVIANGMRLLRKA